MVLLMRETSGARDVGRRFVVVGIGLGGAQMTDAAASGPPDDDSDEVRETDTETERRRAAGDDVLLDALAAGLSYVEAGALAGVSARTARRRLTDPDFASHLARRRAARVSDVTGRLTVGSERACRCCSFGAGRFVSRYGIVAPHRSISDLDSCRLGGGLDGLGHRRAVVVRARAGPVGLAASPREGVKGRGLASSHPAGGTMHAPQQARREMIIAMTAAGRPQAEIAEAINGSVRTVRRWQRDPSIVQAVAAAATAREKSVLAELAALRDRALTVLRDHLADADPMVQYRAAKLSLEQHVVQRRVCGEDQLAAMDAAVTDLVARGRAAGWFR